MQPPISAFVQPRAICQSHSRIPSGDAQKQICWRATIYQHPKSCKRKRKQNIVRFSPPYSELVKTNIGHEVLRLLVKHFPSTYRLLKICNKNNVKKSYCCMPNMALITSTHSKTLLDNRAESNYATPPRNCRNKANCPLEEDVAKAPSCIKQQ